MRLLFYFRDLKKFLKSLLALISGNCYLAGQAILINKVSS